MWGSEWVPAAGRGEIWWRPAARTPAHCGPAPGSPGTRRGSGAILARRPVAMIACMNYELFMGEALAEARLAAARGAPAVGAIAVMNEAMVARGANRVGRGVGPDGPRGRRGPARGRPQARHDAALGRHDLHHPRAVPDVRRRAARVRRGGAGLRGAQPGRTARPARSSSSPSTPASGGASRSCPASAATRRRSSTALQARECRPAPDGRPAAGGVIGPLAVAPSGSPARSSGRIGRSAGAFAILSRGEVSEWLMVPLSKSGLRKQRGFESHPLRHANWSHDPASDRSPGRYRSLRRRGRLVA